MSPRVAPRTARLAAIALTAVLACACSRASETTDAKRSPKPPPSDGLAVPAALHVDVEIDGAPAPALDAARLQSTKPDFADEEHRAWRIATLVGPAAARPHVVVSAVSDKGLALDMRPDATPGGATPVVSLNRRGELHVGLVTPDAPFPDFHGHGGRLNRPGDPLPRLAAPTKPRIWVE